jgi:hypothetical protein
MPDFLELLSRYPGLAKNQVGSAIGDVATRLGLQAQPDYSMAYNRFTRNPMIVSHDPSQMASLESGSFGSTFMQPGDVGVGHGPLAQLVRQNLPSGPVTVLAPGTADPFTRTGLTGQGVPRHETAHQILGDTQVPVQQLFSKLPPEIAQRIQNSGWPADEIGVRLAASTIADPSADPRTTQAYSIGLTPDEARQALNVWLSELAKIDPSKAAKMIRLTGVSPSQSNPQIASR